jgi:N-acetylmuramoyl-L-alanine amidase
MKICIDAGHGGHDSGAVGQNGLPEAPTVLSICHELAAICNNLGWSTLLTRETEVFVHLGERCEISNDWGADIFVSVHLNSDGPDAHGCETLYKTEKGKRIAAPVQKALIEDTGEHDRGLKHRGDLAVLNGTYAPAILVEAGFVSHPATEKELMRPEYLLAIANAIARGLEVAVKTMEEGSEA